MSAVKPRWPAALALAGALLGTTFAALSSSDYAKHLDRQIHDVHCSFVPGLPAASGAENACRAAMYSPYAAILRERVWGGVPIALFGLGTYAFFAAFALYLLLAGPRAPRRAAPFFAVTAQLPLLASIVMGTISAVKLGQFCKTCVGMYASSVLLSVGAIVGVVLARRAAAVPQTWGPAGPESAEGPREGGWLLIPSWLIGLGLFSLTPGLLYVGAVPAYGAYIGGCGKLEKPTPPANTLLRLTPRSAVQPATLFVDPLCPTCKALHQRLAADGTLDKLDLSLVLFPLDNDCNWMLDRAVHPGACSVSKAILCGDHRAGAMLDWAYENQEELLATAKTEGGGPRVRAMIRERWPGLDACIDSKDTSLRLNRTLRYIVNNQLPVSTPQMFLGDQRLCDEDTDMGLAYTVRRLAPALADKGAP